MIDDNDARAAYVQVADILRARIAGRTYTGRFPSEATITQEFGVARETARKAVKILEGEGLVEITKGRGTFVRPR